MIYFPDLVGSNGKDNLELTVNVPRGENRYRRRLVGEERERGRGINEVKSERESASERVREREAFQACAMLWRQRAGKSQTNRWSDK